MGGWWMGYLVHKLKSSKIILSRRRIRVQDEFQKCDRRIIMPVVKLQFLVDTLRRSEL